MQERIGKTSEEREDSEKKRDRNTSETYKMEDWFKSHMTECILIEAS